MSQQQQPSHVFLPGSNSRGYWRTSRMGASPFTLGDGASDLQGLPGVPSVVATDAPLHRLLQSRRSHRTLGVTRRFPEHVLRAELDFQRSLQKAGGPVPPTVFAILKPQGGEPPAPDASIPPPPPRPPMSWNPPTNNQYVPPPGQQRLHNGTYVSGTGGGQFGGQPQQRGTPPPAQQAPAARRISYTSIDGGTYALDLPPKGSAATSGSLMALLMHALCEQGKGGDPNYVLAAAGVELKDATGQTVFSAVQYLSRLESAPQEDEIVDGVRMG